MPPKKGKGQQQQKQQAPSLNVKNVQNKDVMQRVNHLHQCATLLSTAMPPDVLRDASVQKTPQYNDQGALSGRRRQHSKDLGRQMVSQMRDVSKKAVMRLDPALKRPICKGCNTPLVPGITSRIRLKKSGPHRHVLQSTCFNCDKCTRLPAPPIVPDKDQQLQSSRSASLAGAKPSPVAEASPSNDTNMAADPVQAAPEGASSISSLSKKQKKKLRQARSRDVFFKQPQHQLFIGDEPIQSQA